jgi:hypothetical protein
MEYRSKKCTEFGHPEFEFSADSSIPTCDAEWLLGILEDYVVDGDIFDDGETIGFDSIFLIANKAADTIRLAEPDFLQIPIKWIDGVTRSLRILRQQKDTVASFSHATKPDYCSIRESCIVGADFENANGGMVMERTPRMNANDTGWFLGTQDRKLDYSDPKNLLRKSIYEVVCKEPRVLPYLALPVKSRIEHSESCVVFFHDGKMVEPIQGSYLEQVLKRV